MRKPVTYQMIANAALLLMEASPKEQTTTLEVKTLLRNLNLEVTQAEVSDSLKKFDAEFELYSEEVTEDGNTFLAYSLEPIPEDEPEEPQDPSLFAFRV